MLIVFSCVFYGWWNPYYLILIFLSGFIDFFAGLGMDKHPQYRKVFLGLSLTLNLGLLFTYKYLDFFISNANILVQALGAPPLPLAHLVLPVGISFYTFQSLSYTIDIYRGELRPTKNFLHFFAYLSMFPQLVAGPIVRASGFLDQLKKPLRVRTQDFWQGLRFISKGYFKKVVIADNLAPVVTEAFSTPTVYESSAYWWLIIVMFSFQIYCDFSGYSDIAIGLARWCGYRFPQNFNHPYTALSLQHFWSRWHISLSTWFRDYVYIPLGGSRIGPIRTVFNLWITMLLSALWHGAAWTFVLWGALHALYLTIERLSGWPKLLRRLCGAGALLACLLTYLQVLIAWVFFRAENLQQGIDIVGEMFSFSGISIQPILKFPNSEIILTALTLISLREIFIPLKRLAGIPSWWRVCYYYAEPAMISLMLFSCVFFRGPGSVFIYFQF